MTNQEYLESVLADQTLASDSEERKALSERREEVEGILRDSFEESHPTIRYGGSIIKDTLIRESYDLDIICYFEHEDTNAGETDNVLNLC